MKLNILPKQKWVNVPDHEGVRVLITIKRRADAIFEILALRDGYQEATPKEKTAISLDSYRQEALNSIAGWEGVTDMNGDELPLNADSKIAFLSSKGMFEWFNGELAKLLEDDQSQEEEHIKNS